MQKALAAATFAALLGVGGVSSAADLTSGSFKDIPPYGAASSWSGFYFGIDGGYAWSNAAELSSTVDVKHCGHTVPDCQTGTGTGTAGFNSDSGFGGGQIGYNWQRGNIVFGLEADIQGAGEINNAALTSPQGFGSVSASSSLDWFGTVRGRLGVTVLNGGLLYATGGFAYGSIEDKLSGAFASGLSDSHSSNETATGYVVGGGLEYALSRSISVKVEYQYMDLGSTTLTGGTDGLFVDPFSHGSGKWACISTANKLEADHTYNTVRVGLNYHLAPAYEPLK